MNGIVTMSGDPLKSQGGILRSRPKSSKSANGDRSSGRVTFSSNFQTTTYQRNWGAEDVHDDDDAIPIRSQGLRETVDEDEYDSDDVEESILASGDNVFTLGPQKNPDENSEADMEGAAVHSKLDIEDAKRKRGKARQKQNDENVHTDFDSLDGTDGGYQSLSLITDKDADPDFYQSNAGANASCPVEPFNMDAEKESGLGYFDGDTYIFRKKKTVEGEEDAWLDGFGSENEEHSSNIVGGVDSTTIWKPRGDATDTAKKKSLKYVTDGESKESMGSRLVTFLLNDETVMTALTRHGSTLRQLQSQEQKLAKKKGKRRKIALDIDSVTTQPQNHDCDNLKTTIRKTRDIIEEITELADALLFEGETDAYELSKADWIHRFKLELDGGKRPLDNLEYVPPSKKSRHGYFGNTSTFTNASDFLQQSSKTDNDRPGVMWEYKGNEDGAIHGPFTTRQMLEWTSCGYFVGASAVDVRQIGEDNTTQSNADDLMADLMDDDDTNAKVGDTSSEWRRSDAIDFNSYI